MQRNPLMCKNIEGEKGGLFMLIEMKCEEDGAFITELSGMKITHKLLDSSNCIAAC